MHSAHSFRIIIIDDNPSIHHDFIKILKTEPSSNEVDKVSMELFGGIDQAEALPQFEIDVASQGQEGVARIKQALEEQRPYALAFVDIRMPPGWDGIETIKHIWKIDPSMQIVICTAYSDYSWEETVAHLGKTDNLLILKKPFDNISVRQLACALTTKWDLAEKTRNHTDELQQLVADRTVSLEQSLSLVKSTFESSSDGILVISNDGEIIDYNHNFVKMLEIPQVVLNNNKETDFLDYMRTRVINPEEYLQKIKEQKSAPNEINITTIKFNNGKVFECYSQPHKLNDTIIGRILDFRNITQRAKLDRELKYQATHDPLTGLFNRLMLLEKLKIAVKAVSQTESSFAVLFIDLDRFKLINDSLGHSVGDELLKKVALRLQESIRGEDLIARLGGDEFVIVLMNVSKEQDVIEKVRNLMEIFKNPFPLSNRKIALSVSIGISFYPKDNCAVDILLRNADAAMYRAKSKKGNSYEIYRPEMSAESLDLLNQEIELRQAISKGEFFLTYQPQFDLMNEKLVAVEALIRWRHPIKGILLPIDFIPLAEEIGLSLPIGEWVMRTACKQNKIWQEEGYPHIRVAVNVNSEQFKQQNLVEKVNSILQETKLNPKYLEIELTENVIISNPEVINSVNELKKLGVQIAIDDFGTGYSSLSYLHKIPFDRLKIDSSFIQHVQSSKDDEVIARAVIAMAKSLNLEVLAEGVETEAQINFLKKYNCGDVQGFYFSKPLTAEDLEKFFNDYSPEKLFVNNKEK